MVSLCLRTQDSTITLISGDKGSQLRTADAAQMYIFRPRIHHLRALVCTWTVQSHVPGAKETPLKLFCLDLRHSWD